MRLSKDVDIVEFFKDVSRCKGRINLISSEGDYLNLKSGLSRIFVETIFMKKMPTESYDIMISDSEDIKILEKHMQK